MDPVTIGAIGSVASTVLGGLFGKKGAKDQNIANAQQAQKQMDFEERMSNTAVQRRVKDLEAAGLNKMLAYSDSATTPTGAQARMENVNAIPAGSAQEAGKRISEAMLMKAQVNKLNAETRLADSSAAVNAFTVNQEGPSRVGAHNASAQQSSAQAEVLRQTMPKILAEIKQLYSSSDRNEAEAALARVTTTLRGLDAEYQRRIMEFAVSLKDSEAQRARFGIPKARNEGALQDAMGQFGAVRGWMAPALDTAAATGMWIEDILKGLNDGTRRTNMYQRRKEQYGK